MSVHSKEMNLKLEFELPDYCENCPIMYLNAENIIEDQYDGNGNLLSSKPKPNLYCIHEEVCDLWQTIRATENG
jgi:hypothetical protein